MPRRIVIVLERYPDGGGISSIVENYVLDLSATYDVHVAFVEPGPMWDARLALPRDRIHVMGYTNLINPLLLPTSLVYVWRVGAFLSRLQRRLDPAAFLLQDALNLPAPALLATRGSPTKVIVMDHGTLTNVRDHGWLPMVAGRLSPWKRRVFTLGFRADSPWRALRSRIAIRYADALWFTGDELRPWFERADERAHEYAQSVPTDFAPADPEARSLARAAFGLTESETVLNCVGRLDGEKGLDLVVHAANALRNESLPWRLIIAGTGSLEPWLHETIAELNLADRVTLVGQLDRAEVKTLQQASDFHVYAGTMSCGVSICLLEAMASGVVPLVSDVPRLQERLVAESGWVFPAGRADALTGALREALATTASERAILRHRALERIQTGHAPSVRVLLDRELNMAAA